MTITSKEGIKLRLSGNLLTMLDEDKGGCRHEADLSLLADGRLMQLRCIPHSVSKACTVEVTDFKTRRIGCCTFKSADWKLIRKAAKAGKQ